MPTTIEAESLAVTTAPPPSGPSGAPPRVALAVVVGLASVTALATAAWAAVVDPDAGPVVGAVVAGCWAIAAVVLVRRRRAQPLPVAGPTGAPMAVAVAAVALAGGVALAGSAAWSDGGGRGAELARALGTALVLPALASVLVLEPDGRIRARSRRAALAACLVVGGVAAAVLWADRPDLSIGVLLVEGAVLGAVGLAAYVGLCRGAIPVDRARLQWLGWALVVAATVSAVAFGLDALLGWPASPQLVALAASVLVPVALVAATYDAALTWVDRLLVHTIVTAGLVALVAVVYLVVVVGLGRVPADEERSLIGLSMLAAAVAAVLAFPARHRLEEVANQRVYGERRAPDEALKTFAGRMSRAVPMDELLLQLVESLRKSMRLVSAEVWAGTGGVLELVASVPDRPPARLVLEGEELTVVARAHVSGNAWVQVWVPGLMEGRADRVVRVASVAHLGELLGLIVVVREADDTPFTDEDDRALTELARQLGLALHNVRLDSALQASLDELRQRNEELLASRLRIVTAADESRRQIERNLHDGAQQHLVAMAVKIGLARQLVDADPGTTGTLLEELRADVQTTLGELRELAHGIYPPLLRDRGLAEALRTAAKRAVLPTEVDAENVGRHRSEIEAAVYFCCLEAMQNAEKYAGDGARITVSVTESDGRLRFVVADDGAGFEPSDAREGHGFTNMRDRLGSIRGELTVRSSVGGGTRVEGAIPVEDPTAIDAPKVGRRGSAERV